MDENTLAVIDWPPKQGDTGSSHNKDHDEPLIAESANDDLAKIKAIVSITLGLT